MLAEPRASRWRVDDGGSMGESSVFTVVISVVETGTPVITAVTFPDPVMTRSYVPTGTGKSSKRPVSGSGTVDFIGTPSSCNDTVE